MFADERQDELAFLNEEEGDDYSPDDEWECQLPGNCLHSSVDHHESECYTQEMAEDFLKARALGISIDDLPDQT